MLTNLHLVHGATSEPGVRRTSGEGPNEAPQPDKSQKDVTEKPSTRRIRINNNLVSTVFSQDSKPEIPALRTAIRCTYNKNENSHETIFGFGSGPVERRPKMCHREPVRDTKQNIFGDALPVVLCQKGVQVQGNTFDILFGVPEITPNNRRSYEEDTHMKLFGDPDPVNVDPNRDHHGNTQENLFGPPVESPRKVSSRSEDTQLDLFGPPITPARNSKASSKSSWHLFSTDEEIKKPVVMTRAGLINAQSHEKLFGDPPKGRPPPPLKEDTTDKLFGATETVVTSKIETYIKNKFNPITGEGGIDKGLKKKKNKNDVSKSASAKERQAIIRKVGEKHRFRWSKTDTITGEPMPYTTGIQATAEDADTQKNNPPKPSPPPPSAPHTGSGVPDDQ